MGYGEAIKTAIFLFPFIALFFTVPFMLHQYHKYGSINKWRVVIIYSFILYLLVIYFLVILPLPKREDVLNNTNMIRLQPFAFVVDFMKESSFVWNDASTYLKAMTESCFYVPAFNILMTIPFGIYLRYYFQCSFKKTLLYSFCLSLFFEITQVTGLYFIYPKPYRLFDLDDLFLNTLGGVLGYFIAAFFLKVLPSREEIDERSLKEGKTVSGLRRITLFFLDLFLYTFLGGLTKPFIPIPFYLLIFFILYYVVYPTLTRGYTLGGKFLHVRVQFPKYTFLRQAVRIVFLFFYYFGLPILFLYGAGILYYFLSFSVVEALWYWLIVGSFFLGFYFIHFVKLLKKKTLFYDRWFHVLYESTI